MTREEYLFVENLKGFRSYREIKRPDPFENQVFKWCHQESNRGHKDFQSFALPTELWHQHFVFATNVSRLRLQRYANFWNLQTFQQKKCDFCVGNSIFVGKVPIIALKNLPFRPRISEKNQKGRSFILSYRRLYPFNGFQPCAFSSSSLPSRVTSAQPSSGLVM